MEKRWIQRRIPDAALLDGLKRIPGVSGALAVLLGQRGIRDFDEAKAFFNPELSGLHDPFLMAGMEEAVDRIGLAINKGEKILVYGDYDVDGTTAVSVFYSFLREHHDRVDYYIPDRYLEGYGISGKGIETARDQGFSLMVSLDCGVKSVELIRQAKEWGIDFIVCDHHQPGEQLPPAVAVLDPKRKDCSYPYKELSGCGVGFKLAQALCMKYDWDPEGLFRYLDLLAVSIACDIVEIRGENRILAYQGMKKLNSNPNTGLKALLEIAFAGKEKKRYDVSDVLFYAGPRINAAGRLEHAYGAVDLLIEQDEQKAREFASRLHTTNDVRKELEAEITKAAIAQCNSMPGFDEMKSTVVYHPEWNKGVIGIVASRLVEEFYRPTIVLTRSGEKVAGSARSVQGFDIHAAIEACEQHLLQFGGHTHAAGLTMEPERVDDFRKAFDEVVQASIREESLQPIVEFDLPLDLGTLQPNFVKNLLRMAPFGPGNQNPLFVSRKVKDTGMAKNYGEHLSLNFFTGAGVVGGMAFFQGQHLEEVKQGKLFDICYHIDLTEFNGKERLQLRIVDMKLAD